MDNKDSKWQSKIIDRRVRLMQQEETKKASSDNCSKWYNTSSSSSSSSSKDNCSNTGKDRYGNQSWKQSSWKSDRQKYSPYNSTSSSNRFNPNSPFSPNSPFTSTSTSLSNEKGSKSSKGNQELQLCSEMAKLGWNNPYCSSKSLIRHQATSELFKSKPEMSKRTKKVEDENRPKLSDVIDRIFSESFD
ncbi:hypothetical protein BLOT_003481 [Blomia tropicalis]|nr:hypothetical protein BLOT_003481 [Blomia tropicalis]